MDSQAKIMGISGAKAREEPARHPFRFYFALAYIVAGITILVYTTK